MIKVLIVDDEPLPRKLVAHCLANRDFDLTVVGEASNANDGMELIETLRPDVVITDIMMPGTDGIEFTKIIKDKFPHIRVILISGYDDFEYANQGIKLGVLDYIVKPINQEAIVKVAQKVWEDIEEERQHKEEFNKLKEELNQNAEYIKEKALYSLVLGQNSRAALECLDYFGVDLHNGIYQTAVIDCSPDGEHARGNKEHELERIIKSLKCKRTIARYAAEYEGIYVFSADTKMINLLNNNTEIDFDEFCETMRCQIEDELNNSLYIGVGNRYGEIGQIKHSFHEALEALAYWYAIGDSHTVCFEDICMYSTANRVSIDEEILHKFSFLVRSGMVEDVSKLMNELFTEMKNNGISKDDATVFAVKLLMEVLPVFRDITESSRGVKQDIASVTTKIMAQPNLNDLQMYLTNTMVNITNVINETFRDKADGIVDNVVSYINENYMDEELSLADIAKKYFVNSSYLSRIFKEKVGKPFRDYLFEVRMGNAKRLFEQSDLKAYEVSVKCGIKDPSYFSVCFKKYTGKSVNQYKQDISG
ncbi:MAG: response regulator [Suipraeoptans sp.]